MEVRLSRFMNSVSLRSRAAGLIPERLTGRRKSNLFYPEEVM